MNVALELGQRAGQAAARRVLGMPRATMHRHLQPAAPQRLRPTPDQALDAAGRRRVKGIYLRSIRTMHRILAQLGS